MPSILDGLPAIYRGLLPAFFEREVPNESKATCSNCAMCQGGSTLPVESVDGSNHFFRPDTKCCTYHPRLPGYLVGALLSDADPSLAEGRRRIEQKIAARVGITPLWVKPPGKYNFLYNNARRAFGRAGSLLCPFYEQQGGLCTIWKYREAVCSTFFCKYIAGEDGRKFWMTMKSYLSILEIQLSRYAAMKLIPDFILEGRDRKDGTEGAMSAEDLDDRPLPAKEYALLWREWAGREAELYKRSYEIVRDFPAADVEKLLGLDATIELAILDKLHRGITSPKLPNVLRFNPGATVKWLSDGSVALGSYSENDAVALPGEAYQLLIQFNGRDPVPTVRQRLRDTMQADLDDSILLELYRHRILTEA
jgi:Fe-S-cluster containining protein